MAYFIKFNGVSSEGLFKIVKAPTRVMATKKIELFSLNTMDGNSYKDYGTYEAYELELECRMVGNFSVENIQKVKEMFLDYEGKLEFSDEAGIYYKARLNNIIPFDETSLVSGEFPLSFSVYPKAYIIEGEKEIVIKSNDIITNLGNQEAEPIIKVIGARDKFEIKIVNNEVEQNMYFRGLPGKEFTIDCNLEDCYSVDKENYNLYLNLDSDFVKLGKGENKIIFDPVGVTVKIIPNWVRL